MKTPRDAGISAENPHCTGISDDKIMREVLRCLFTEAPEPMVLFNIEGEIVGANSAACRELAYSYREMLALNLFSDLVASPPPMKMEPLCRSLPAGQALSIDGTLRRKDGGAVPFRTITSLLFGENGSLLLYSAGESGHRGAVKETSRKSALRDPLTGLSSRTLFEDELERMDTERFLPLSVIRGDVNGMKLVNASFGHAVGDKLLKTAAKVLRKQCRSSDLLVRWEDDEFLLLLPRTREDDAASVVGRIEDAFRKTRVKEIPVPPSISLGYAAKVHRWQDFRNVLKEAEEDMREKQLPETRKIRSKILSSLLESLDEFTPETDEHISAMRSTAQLIGKCLGLAPAEMHRLDISVRLHDIGKAVLPPQLLNKTAPLTEEDRETLQKHPVTGSGIAESATPEAAEVADVIHSHHERYDGTGYPEGLAGESIPLLSRILSIVDAFDVMTRGTPYKEPLSAENALVQLKKNAGLQFDPGLVSLFINNADKIQDGESVSPSSRSSKIG
jgi:diguanylate cyclase (GGDEF)-like protein/PAS domain S-box-containing protein